jgi:hypothetical protein
MVETAADDGDVLATASKMERYKRVQNTGRLIQEIANYSHFRERRNITSEEFPFSASHLSQVAQTSLLSPLQQTIMYRTPLDAGKHGPIKDPRGRQQHGGPPLSIETAILTSTYPGADNF